MCGIAGIFDRSGREGAKEGALRQMLSLLRHRGPDEFGILLDHETGLGNARLSIIDLTGGGQPIANEDNTLWIVFNGEIFNYIELRAQLELRGHVFRTSTDTEVILHLFEEYGSDCLSRLNGQFAIAIWDTNRRRLFLARDRLGVRPLFYTQVGNTLLFASEIKALLADRRVTAELNPAVVEQIFRFWAPPAAATVFRNILQLLPGHFLTADRYGVQIRRYWQQEFPLVKAGHSKDPGTDALAEEFRSLLIDACRIRLRADVPVGAYLSGGLDSSTIAAIVRRHTTNRLVTFSIAFNDDDFDESQFQKQMAAHLGTAHHVLQVTHEQIGRAFPQVIWHTELPILRTAPVPMFLLSKLVRDTGFKVVLTGEGADEFLAGYDIFKENKIRRFWARQPESKCRPRLLKRLYGDIRGITQGSPDFLAAFFGHGLTELDSPWYSHAIRWRNNARSLRFFQEHILEQNKDACFESLTETLPAVFHNWEPLARAQFLECSVFLSQYLLSSQGDRMGMAHSIEGRFPFLDLRVVEFCNSLPPSLKLRGLNEKFLLKKAAQPFLPALIRQRPKRPYRAPIHRSLFCSATSDYIDELLGPESLADCGLFRPQTVEALLNKLRAGAPIGETDDMALAGMVSTQLIHHLFVKRFSLPAPLSDLDSVKVCQASPASRRKGHSVEPTEPLTRA